MKARNAVDTCVVIPCFNEARRLSLHEYSDALEAIPWLFLCFVDDGSTDATYERLSNFSAKSNNRCHIIRHPENRGKGEAVRTGMRWGATRFAFCGFWDADLAAPLSQLPLLHDALMNEDAVRWAWGIRLRSLGRQVERGAMRHYLGRGFATIASAILNTHCYDSQCGAKLFRCDESFQELLSRPFVSRWLFDLELLLRLRSTVPEPTGGRTVIEVPLNQWVDKAGSKVRPRDALHALLDLYRIRRNTLATQ